MSPSFANTGVELLEHVRMNQIILLTKKGTGACQNKKRMWVIGGRDVYVIFIHPDDYRRLLEIMGTSTGGAPYQWEESKPYIRIPRIKIMDDVRETIEEHREKHSEDGRSQKLPIPDNPIPIVII